MFTMIHKNKTTAYTYSKKRVATKNSNYKQIERCSQNGTKTGLQKGYKEKYQTTSKKRWLNNQVTRKVYLCQSMV